MINMYEEEKFMREQLLKYRDVLICLNESRIAYSILKCLLYTAKPETSMLSLREKVTLDVKKFSEKEFIKYLDIFIKNNIINERFSSLPKYSVSDKGIEGFRINAIFQDVVLNEIRKEIPDEKEKINEGFVNFLRKIDQIS